MNILLYLFIIPLINKIRELNYQYRFYPRWLKKPDSSRIHCKTDDDCIFPAACCNDPFFPLQFCCYGWNKRQLKYAYIMEYVKS